MDSALRLHDPAPDTALILQNLLELALPLAAGVGAASLVGRDPAVELQLTLPTAYRATILRRLAASTGWVAVVALTVVLGAVATGWWDRWPGAHTPLAGQLTWLAPTAFLAGLGLLVGALAGSAALAAARSPCCGPSTWPRRARSSTTGGPGSCTCSPPPAAAPSWTGRPTG